MPGIVQRYFPDLTRGYHGSLPSRAMDPDAGLPYIWKDALNLIEREGAFARRAILGDDFSSSIQPPYQLLTGSTNDAEIPVYIFALDCRAGSGGSATDDVCLIVVTNRNIWIKLLLTGAWKLCTPTYTTGTISATNGLPTINGAGGMLWATHIFTAGGILRDDATGTHYKITSIAAETTLGITPNWSGTTGAGKAYTIYRTFQGGATLDVSASEIFATVFNSDLYVAGTFIGTSDPAFRAPAVIRVANIFSASPTTTYVTGQRLLSAGLDFVSNLDRIAGLRALQDGRLVVAGAQNVSFYSSHLNTAVWTVSPAGQTPLLDIDGRVNALGNIGTVLTYHHNEGVVLGYPTAQADPPLKYINSKATAGVYAPRSLKETGGIEYGLAVNGSVIRFDLDRSTTVSDPIKGSLVNLLRSDLYLFHGCIDKDRNEYTLLRMVAPDTFGWTYQADYDRWWPLRFAAPIGAISDGMAISIFDSSYRGVVGLSTIDGTEVSKFMYYYRESTGGDTVTYASGSNGGFYVTTDDLDFGNPLTYKAIQKVILWAIGTGGTGSTVQVSISRDQGVNWTAAATETFSSSNSAEQIKQFCFDELTPGADDAWRIKIEHTGATNVAIQFRRLLVSAVEGGVIDAVQLF